MNLLRQVEDRLRRAGISASRFGREAVGDPRLVHDMRRGRQLGPRLRAQVESHLMRTHMELDARAASAITLKPGAR